MELSGGGAMQDGDAGKQERLSSSVSLLIEHCVVAGAAARYEAWLKEIVPVARRFQGHQGIDIVRPSAGSSHYTLLLRFDCTANLRTWLDSTERAALIRRIEPWLAADEKLQTASGLDFLFTEGRGPANGSPARYKQFLMTLSAIYPLTTLVPPLVQAVAGATPWRFAGWVINLVISSIIVYLMVYVVMPPYTRLAAKWLKH